MLSIVQDNHPFFVCVCGGGGVITTESCNILYHCFSYISW